MDSVEPEVKKATEEYPKGFKTRTTKVYEDASRTGVFLSSECFAQSEESCRQTKTTVFCKYDCLKLFIIRKIKTENFAVMLATLRQRST